MVSNETLARWEDAQTLEKRVSRRYVLKVVAVVALGSTVSGCGASAVVIPLAIEIVQVLAATVGIATLTLKIILIVKDLADQLALNAQLTGEQLAKLKQGAKLLLEDADGNQFEVPFTFESLA